MVLDHVDESTEQYVIQNTDFGNGGPVLRVPKTRAYYAYGDYMYKNQHGPGEYYYRENGMFMWLANERFGNTMQPKTWYLLPQAYSIVLTPEYELVSSSSESSDESDDTSSDEEKNTTPVFNRSPIFIRSREK